MSNPTITHIRDTAKRVAQELERPLDAVRVSWGYYTADPGDTTPPGGYWEVTVSMPRARSTKGYSLDVRGLGNDDSLDGLRQGADEVIDSVKRGRERGDFK